MKILTKNSIDTIHHHTLNSPLGPITMGQTPDNSICFLGFTHNPKKILNYYPNASLIASSATQFPTWNSLLKDNFTLITTPSPLQLLTWNALLNIKSGQTTSYSNIAQSINKPTAIRATATAIGQNPISLLIPCHRILRKDNSIGQYAWGSPIKQKLLDLEKSSL